MEEVREGVNGVLLIDEEVVRMGGAAVGEELGMESGEGWGTARP